MKNITFLFSLLLFYVMPTQAQEARVYLSTPNTQIKSGSEFYVDVLVEGLPKLYGVELKMEYDFKATEVLDQDVKKEGVQIESGNFFKNETLFTLRNSADPNMGNIEYVVSQVAPASEVAGDGRIARLKLKAITTAPSGTIQITSAEFGTREGEVMRFPIGPALNLSFGETYEVPEKPKADIDRTAILVLVISVVILFFSALMVLKVRRA